MSDERSPFTPNHVYPTVSSDPAVQGRYMDMRDAGETHSMAEMLALRAFPGVSGTDREFLQGRALDGSQFEGQGIVGEHHVAKARDAGVNTAGKYFLGGLARFPGDPRAWVSSRSDVKGLCEREGWECRGAVNVDAPKYDERYTPKPYAVAPKIVAIEVAKTIAADPDAARRPRDELTHEVATRLGGRHGGKV